MTRTSAFWRLALLPVALATSPTTAPPAPASTHETSVTFVAGKWTYFASANCRCADKTCKVITCSGESGVSYEDARVTARLSLEAQARWENGQIEGIPSIVIRFETK